MPLKKLSFTHWRTKRLGAISVRAGSGESSDSCRRSGLIQVLNCCALSSFSKYSRQASQKVSGASMILMTRWGRNGSCERGERDILDRSSQLIHRERKKYRLTWAAVKSCNVEFYLSGIGEIMKRTYQPSVTRRKRTHGFR